MILVRGFVLVDYTLRVRLVECYCYRLGLFLCVMDPKSRSRSALPASDGKALVGASNGS